MKIKIIGFEPFIPYTSEDFKKFEEERLNYEKYHKWIKEQNFKVGDFVIFEGEKCEILHIFGVDECILQHKNRKEEHLLRDCKK